MRLLWNTVLLSGLFLLTAQTAHAGTSVTTKDPTDDLRSRSAVILDATTGTHVLAYNAEEAWPIASLTKLMTALVVLDLEPQWDRNVTYQAADNREGARLIIRPGDQVTVQDLFNTMLLGSANNATITLARSTGLPLEQFVARMNEKAKAFGLTHTTFTEPTGLDLGNVSTAEEYAELAKQAFGHPVIRRVTTRRVYSFRTAKYRVAHRIKNSNALLTSGLTVLGGKTGYLEESGYSMVLKTQAGAHEYITVVLGNPSSWGRFAEAKWLAQAAATL